MATTKRTAKSSTIKARIAELQTELQAAERHEHKQAQDELLILLDRTHMLEKTLAWAHEQTDRKPHSAEPQA